MSKRKVRKRAVSVEAVVAHEMRDMGPRGWLVCDVLWSVDGRRFVGTENEALYPTRDEAWADFRERQP